MERVRSKKLRALEQVLRQPWWRVAQEWGQKPISQHEIAKRWTVLVSGDFPGMFFRQQEVSEILRRAARRAESEATLEALA